MIEEPFVVKVVKIEETEDGGCFVEFDMNEHATDELRKIGLEFMLYCAAHDLDLQYVLDNLHTLKRDYQLEFAFD